VTVGPRRNVHDRLRFLRRAGRPFEVAQVRWFGTSALSALFKTPVLLLHTTGRRTGKPRTTPLAFHRGDDGELLIVGGAAGQARNPDWAANLRSTPSASVTVDRVRLDVRAEEMIGPDRHAAWETLRMRWPRIDTYQQRSGRAVPVFRLVEARA
jgi:deazaflavin-dependent oxidoreductase (nitroreductase family)